MKKPLLVTVIALSLCALSASATVKETWEKTCAKCHGVDGKGDTKIGKKLEIKDFTDAKYQDSLKDDAMFKAVKEGLKDGEKLRMKPAEGLSDDEIKGLVAYVRGLKK